MGDAVMRLQEALRAYGYGIPCTGEYCEDTEFVVTAFQRHFRPALADGRATVTSPKNTECALKQARVTVANCRRLAMAAELTSA